MLSFLFFLKINWFLFIQIREKVMKNGGGKIGYEYA
jgi:hypothetical protein